LNQLGEFTYRPSVRATLLNPFQMDHRHAVSTLKLRKWAVPPDH